MDVRENAPQGKCMFPVLGGLGGTAENRQAGARDVGEGSMLCIGAGDETCSSAEAEGWNLLLSKMAAARGQDTGCEGR